MTRLGNERVLGYPGLPAGNIRRYTYSIFDVSRIHRARKARIEFYIFAPSKASSNTGAYSSPDPQEVIELHALDHFSPQQLIGAPVEDKSNHSLDPLIAADLADGQLYARKTIRPEMVKIDKISPSPTATPTTSDCADKTMRTCGRWISFELTEQAIKDINASKGLWAAGWHMVSVTHDKAKTSVREFLFFGGHIDLDPTKSSYPSHLRPKPRLIVE